MSWNKSVWSRSIVAQKNCNRYKVRVALNYHQRVINQQETLRIHQRKDLPSEIHRVRASEPQRHQLTSSIHPPIPKHLPTGLSNVTLFVVCTDCLNSPNNDQLLYVNFKSQSSRSDIRQNSVFWGYVLYKNIIRISWNGSELETYVATVTKTISFKKYWWHIQWSQQYIYICLVLSLNNCLLITWIISCLSICARLIMIACN